MRGACGLGGRGKRGEERYGEEKGPTFICHTLLVISYEPGPEPVSAASPPVRSFHFWASKYQTAREKRPAATR